MSIVYLYSGVGRFTGANGYDWACPGIGTVHKFILFLSQEMALSQQEQAELEMARYGFGELQIGEGKMIVVEALNSPGMQAFQKYYEGALSEGSSVVWYP